MVTLIIVLGSVWTLAETADLYEFLAGESAIQLRFHSDSENRRQETKDWIEFVFQVLVGEKASLRPFYPNKSFTTTLTIVF